jgi:hypothetical protein
MLLYWILGGTVLLLIIAIGIYLAGRPRDPEMLHPKGYWMGVGISFGLLFGMIAGIALGVAFDDVSLGITLGPGMGIAIGVAIGAALEEKNKGQVRPLTEAELRMQRWAIYIGLIVLLIGIAVFLLFVYAVF